MTHDNPVSEGTLGRVGRAMPWTIVSQFVYQGFGIATSIIVVRSLGQFNYGVFSLLRSILGFATTIMRGGLMEAMLRYLPELQVKREVAGIRVLLWTVVKFQTVLAIVVLLAGWLLRDELAGLFRRPELAAFVAVGLGLTLFEAYHDTVQKSAIALYETKVVALAAALGSVLTLACVVLFLRMGWGIVGVLLATSAGHLLAGGLLLRKVLQRTLASRSAGMPIQPRRLLNFALPFLAVNLMVLITWRQSETIFLSYFWTPLEAGLFDLAYRLPQRMLEFVPGAVFPLVMVGFSEALSKDLDHMRRGIVTYYKMLFFLVAPISLFGILYADRFIEIMYGGEMAAAGPLCQVFFLVFMSSFFGTPLSMSIYAIEKTWVNMLFYVVSTVIIVGLDLVLIPPYGLWGAVLPVTLITVASPFARYLLANHLVGGIVIPWPFIGRMYLASASLGLFLPFKSRIDSPARLLALCAVAGVVVLVGLKVFRVFGREERDLLARSNLPMRGTLLRLL